MPFLFETACCRSYWMTVKLRWVGSRRIDTVFWLMVEYCTVLPDSSETERLVRFPCTKSTWTALEAFPATRWTTWAVPFSSIETRRPSWGAAPIDIWPNAGPAEKTTSAAATAIRILSIVYSEMDTRSILASWFGQSFLSRGRFTILSATSMPLLTSPNTVYCLSRKVLSVVTMKNCEPALFGSAARAIETIPLRWDLGLNSALIVYPGPPVPHFDLS